MKNDHHQPSHHHKRPHAHGSDIQYQIICLMVIAWLVFLLFMHKGGLL